MVLHAQLDGQRMAKRHAVVGLVNHAHSAHETGLVHRHHYKRMQRLTHDMENVFQEIRSGNMKVQPELIDVLFRGLDALEGEPMDK